MKYLTWLANVNEKSDGHSFTAETSSECSVNEKRGLVWLNDRVFSTLFYVMFLLTCQNFIGCCKTLLLQQDRMVGALFLFSPIN